MKIILIVLLLTTQARALNRTFLNMPPNRDYMGFVLSRYLDWHRSHFPFPEDTPLLRTLLSGIDHWEAGTYERQFTLGHYGKVDGNQGYRLRLFVHPSLRDLPALRLPGREARTLRFVEWDSQGAFCQLYEVGPKLEALCRSGERGKFLPSWVEELVQKLPPGWEVPFPVLGEKIVVRRVGEKITEVVFFDVVPHPSLIPGPLRKSVFLHTKDGLLPLDRVGVDQKRNWIVYYP